MITPHESRSPEFRPPSPRANRLITTSRGVPTAKRPRPAVPRNHRDVGREGVAGLVPRCERETRRGEAFVNVLRADGHIFVMSGGRDVEASAHQHDHDHGDGHGHHH